jgi:hypothetical protein
MLPPCKGTWQGRQTRCLTRWAFAARAGLQMRSRPGAAGRHARQLDQSKLRACVCRGGGGAAGSSAAKRASSCAGAPIRPSSSITGCTHAGIIPKSSPQTSISVAPSSAGRVLSACERQRASCIAPLLMHDCWKAALRGWMDLRWEGGMQACLSVEEVIVMQLGQLSPPLDVKVLVARRVREPDALRCSRERPLGDSIWRLEADRALSRSCPQKYPPGRSDSSLPHLVAAPRSASA